MGNLDSSSASLRIVGDALNPAEISGLLSAEPSVAYLKGDIYHFKTGSAVRKSGMWSLKVTDRHPGDLDGQCVEILDRLTDDEAIWKDLSVRFKIDIFVGLFMDGSNEGVTVSPETMERIGRRGIRLNLCLYAPTESETA